MCYWIIEMLSNMTQNTANTWFDMQLLPWNISRICCQQPFLPPRNTRINVRVVLCMQNIDLCIVSTTYRTRVNVWKYIWDMYKRSQLIKAASLAFVWRIHRSTVNSPHKGQWRGALLFSLICAWINAWVNNREAGDLKRRRTHYIVIVMIYLLSPNDHLSQHRK